MSVFIDFVILLYWIVNHFEQASMYLEYKLIFIHRTFGFCSESFFFNYLTIFLFVDESEFWLNLLIILPLNTFTALGANYSGLKTLTIFFHAPWFFASATLN
jgi:hypothetical protein